MCGIVARSHRTQLNREETSGPGKYFPMRKDPQSHAAPILPYLCSLQVSLYIGIVFARCCQPVLHSYSHREEYMNMTFAAVLITGLTAFFAAMLRGIGLDQLINPDALLIIFGGTIIALLIGFPLTALKAAARDVRDAFTQPPDDGGIVGELIALGRLCRTADMRRIEAKVADIRDGFLRRGMTLLINNHDEASIRRVMETECNRRTTRAGCTISILRTVARLAPALGLAGTVISLIKMFHDMRSIETVAPLMAVALMSTFYGVILSNVLMMPLCAKIKDRAIHEEMRMTLTIEGILAIYHGEHPLRIEERLSGFSVQDGPLAEPQPSPVRLAGENG